MISKFNNQLFLSTCILIAALFSNYTSAEANNADSVEIDPVAVKFEPLIKLVEQLHHKETTLTATGQLLKNEKNPLKKEELITSIAEQKHAIKTLKSQISSIATGISDSDFDIENSKKIDLQSELQQLVEPFVIMLRSATDQARQIETLRRNISEGRRLEALASSAITNLDAQLNLNPPDKTKTALLALKNTWQERLQAALDLKTSSEVQLQQKEQAREAEATRPSKALTDFFVGRGLSLILGFTVFVVSFGLLRLFAWLVNRYRTKRGKQRSFRVRLAYLFYISLSLLLSTVLMLAVFNARNDWFLLGLTVLVMIGLTWFAIKLLPSFITQIVIYLNLGAVQENERIMFHGIPWQVKKLDWQTDLINPALECGIYTLPIRELDGLHSRPTSNREQWFPTKAGDWVKLDDGIAQIKLQSPEVVVATLLGGAEYRISTEEFYANPPLNLSHGSRAEIIFGIGYSHQTEAVDSIINKLKQHVEAGLLKMLNKDELVAVGVEILEAADSSINFEVEADITGAAAAKYEDVERELARLCIDACNKHGWEIPFPQMVIHKI